MIDENMLYRRAISPVGRLVREPTFLGAVLILAFGSVFVVFLALAVGWAIALLR